MRVLVTGAAGFIGSHLTDRLLAHGHTVWGVDNYLTGRRDNVQPGDALAEADITDRRSFYTIANELEPELVIHCAASYSDPNLWHRDTDTNIAGTINAINVAKHHGARLIYFQTALPPISSYAISKIAGEQYIALSGVSALIFRLANIYGPRNLSGPIPTFYKRLTNGDPCTVVDTRREMVYIGDLVDLVTAAIYTGAEGKFDVCTGAPYLIEDLYRAVVVAGGFSTGPPPEIVAAPEDDVKQMELEGFVTELFFGWKPETGLDVGVKAAVDWYRERGVTDTYTHLTLKG
jgi:UDP-glucose 4-epimerase